MEKKIRVAEVVEATTAGTRRHVTELVCALDPARFAVTVLGSTRRDPGFLADIDRMRRHGVDVAVVPMVRPISPFRDAAALFRLLGLLRRGRFDVVHTHSSKAGFLGRLAARLAGVPRVVHTPHTFAFQMEVSPFSMGLYRTLERLAACWTDRLICVCEAEREAARRAGLDRAGRCVVIPNGLPASAFEPTPDKGALRRRLGLRPEDRVVGMIGRLASQKSPLDLVAAAAFTLKREPDVRFVLVGDGPLMPAVRREIDALGLGDRVFAPGALENGAGLVSAFDVFVLPSRWESLPYSLLEAMAAGVAIVATPVGGVPDVIVHEKTGLLAPAGSPACLALAILELLEDKSKRRTLGAAARGRAEERYRLEPLVDRIERIYAGA